MTDTAAELAGRLASRAPVDHHCHGIQYQDVGWLPELHYLGAARFRRALSEFPGHGQSSGLSPEQTAVHVAGLLCAGNARRVYRLGDQV